MSCLPAWCCCCNGSRSQNEVEMRDLSSASRAPEGMSMEEGSLGAQNQRVDAVASPRRRSQRREEDTSCFGGLPGANIRDTGLTLSCLKGTAWIGVGVIGYFGGIPPQTLSVIAAIGGAVNNLVMAWLATQAPRAAISRALTNSNESLDEAIDRLEPLYERLVAKEKELAEAANALTAVRREGVEAQEKLQKKIDGLKQDIQNLESEIRRREDSINNLKKTIKEGNHLLQSFGAAQHAADESIQKTALVVQDQLIKMRAQSKEDEQRYRRETEELQQLLDQDDHETAQFQKALVQSVAAKQVGEARTLELELQIKALQERLDRCGTRLDRLGDLKSCNERLLLILADVIKETESNGSLSQNTRESLVKSTEELEQTLKLKPPLPSEISPREFSRRLERVLEKLKINDLPTEKQKALFKKLPPCIDKMLSTCSKSKRRTELEALNQDVKELNTHFSKDGVVGEKELNFIRDLKARLDRAIQAHIYELFPSVDPQKQEKAAQLRKSPKGMADGLDKMATHMEQKCPITNEQLILLKAALKKVTGMMAQAPRESRAWNDGFAINSAVSSKLKSSNPKEEINVRDIRGIANYIRLEQPFLDSLAEEAKLVAEVERIQGKFSNFYAKLPTKIGKKATTSQMRKFEETRLCIEKFMANKDPNFPTYQEAQRLIKGAIAEHALLKEGKLIDEESLSIVQGLEHIMREILRLPKEHALS